MNFTYLMKKHEFMISTFLDDCVACLIHKRVPYERYQAIRYLCIESSNQKISTHGIFYFTKLVGLGEVFSSS